MSEAEDTRDGPGDRDTNATTEEEPVENAPDPGPSQAGSSEAQKTGSAHAQGKQICRKGRGYVWVVVADRGLTGVYVTIVNLKGGFRASFRKTGMILQRSRRHASMERVCICFVWPQISVKVIETWPVSYASFQHMNN
ncbi:hypothetical protein FDENT_4086 [Fusarium denticulatum]|uniref:Uncharacterized protein n=1 Tax=Fusarium denticulatum TaxID=48507 RepID=A0A8H5XAP1_9HYPO|nr:hypothetical protein FDENT_4086 [Fusarium denticulatum]